MAPTLGCQNIDPASTQVGVADRGVKSTETYLSRAEYVLFEIYLLLCPSLGQRMQPSKESLPENQSAGSR